MSTRSVHRLFVAGADYLIGRAIVAQARAAGRYEIASDAAGHPAPTDAAAVLACLREVRPDYVVIAAGKCGGIGRNRREPATLMMHNLAVVLAYLQALAVVPVRKVLYLGSSCMYPRDAAQPLHPDVLGTGLLEPTSAPYAQAKLAGLMLCAACRQEFGTPAICAIPSTPFGPWDTFDPADAHVVGALIQRLTEAAERSAPEVVVWGTGRPRRDFIYVDDVADACLFLLDTYDRPAPINIGAQTHTSIAELAEAIRQAVGYRGRIVFDADKPDGAPMKALDTSCLRSLGWQPRWSLNDALRATCAWYRQHRHRVPSSS